MLSEKGTSPRRFCWNLRIEFHFERDNRTATENEFHTEAKTEMTEGFLINIPALGYGSRNEGRATKCTITVIL